MVKALDKAGKNMTTTGIRLFVIGDSFTVATGPTDTTMTWIRQTAQQLSALHGEPVTVVNKSIMGSSQDWCWMQLHTWMETGITERDYLIVGLTHPGRYWYLDRLPELSNSNIIDLDSWCSQEESKAIELFIKHIQRPSLDTISLINRLGWLGYQVLKKNLRKPLIIKCFSQDLYQFESMDELIVSQGAIFDDIQYWEFASVEMEHNSDYFGGRDCRYNHLTLSNHKILAERIVRSLYHGEDLDLKSGYIRGILTPGALEDPDFCQRELDLHIMEKRKHHIVSTGFSPWKRRVNIDKRSV